MQLISRTTPLSRLVAVCLSALIAVPLPLAAGAQQAQPAQQLPDAPTPPSHTNSETAMAKPPATPVPEGWSSSQAQQAPDTQDADQQQPAQPQKPVGTAAAPVTRPTGIAGARPSGAAIAPAKQRRVHAIFIRVALSWPPRAPPARSSDSLKPAPAVPSNHESLAHPISVSFSGVDGAGKSTQIQALTNALERGRHARAHSPFLG